MAFKVEINVQNGVSRKKEICGMFDVYDWNAFTWKIHNLSLIPNVVDYVVQSPSFYFENASWILKMFLYGQTQFKTEGHMDIIIERLNSETPMSHEIFCKIYKKDPSNDEFNHKILNFKFDSEWTYSRVHRLMQSPKESELNDPFTLVVEFGTREMLVIGSTKAAESTVGQESTIIKKIRSPEIGEVFSEFLEFKTFRLKFYDLPSPSPIPADFGVGSPEFSFANALWSLKAVPYYIEHSSEPNILLVLERLQSEIPEQNVMFKMIVTDDINSDKITDRSILFNSSHTEEEVLYFPWNISLFHVKISMKIKNTAAEPAIDHCGISRPSGVLRNFKKLFLSQDDTDIIIRVKEQEFRAHKLVLKAQSPVFSAAFRSDMQEKVTGVINIEDCDPSTLHDFLCFLYCGEVRKLSGKTAFDLFTLADKYNVSDLRSLCMEFIKMNLSVNTFCETLELALLHSESDPELIELSRDFFAKNVQKILETDKWKSFADQNPELSNEIKALVPDENVDCDNH